MWSAQLNGPTVLTAEHHIIAHQNLLDLRQCGFGLVHDHFLSDFFPPLHAVEFVVCVAVQNRPAEELCQGLKHNRGALQ